MVMTIVNLKNGNVIADKVIFAGTFIKRLKGLMFESNMKKGECLIISPCKMIHTFEMKFPFDIVFLSKSNIVIETNENIRVNRISSFVLGTSAVLELPGGTVKETNMKKRR